MLSNEFGIKHLSAGELLREERQNTESEYGKLIDSYLKEGKIVPVEISLGLLRKAIEECNCNRYLVDGFPRNFDNVEGWNRLMAEVSDVEKVLFIECNEVELERRLLQRGQTSGRTDDNLNTARKRFQTFKEATLPVVHYYADQRGRSDDDDDDVDGSESVTEEESKSNKMLFIVDGAQSVKAVYSELRESVIECVKKEIISLTKDIYREENDSSSDSNKFKVVTNDVNMVTGKTAVIKYDIIEQDGSGNVMDRKSCTDKWTLGSIGWNRET